MARAKKKTTKKKSGAIRFVAHEVVAVIATALACFFVFALISAQQVRGLVCGGQQHSLCQLNSNLMGPVGSDVAGFLFDIFGYGSLVAGLIAVMISIQLWQHPEENPSESSSHPIVRQLIAILGTLIFTGSIVALWFPELGSDGNPGGIIGGFSVSMLRPLFGGFGTSILLLSLIVLTVQYALESSIIDLSKGVIAGISSILTLLFKTISAGSVLLFKGSGGVLNALASLLGVVLFGIWKGLASALKGVGYIFRSISQRMKERSRQRETFSEPPLSYQRANRKNRVPEKTLADEKIVVVKHETPPLEALFESDATGNAREVPTSSNNDFEDYQPPSYDLLDTKKSSEKVVLSEDQLVECSKRIQEKLADFNVLGRVTHVHPGPVITMYEFEPAAGIKVGKIVSLQDDLAMALRAPSVRIIAPLAERGSVGIEVPNDEQEIVRLSELLGSAELEKSSSSLAIPLGKDTFGKPVAADIASMPHLLLAGATGTGKSVCINALLLSLLYRAHPRELQLILIDPKILELSVYEGIPHLKVPVVSDPRKAKAVLQWAVQEMDRRYRLLKDYGVRSIDAFNEMIESGEPRPVVRSSGADAKVVDDQQSLPKIVIVIDELADLMLMSGRDVEELITRLAQKARAAGIHMILATQRPSVDVITGLIKANFPARVSFRVSSRIDSRTILDSMGAERLLGKGDMLFLKPGAHSLRRVHGAFVSDREVRDVTKQLRESSEPHYDQEILELCEKALEEQGSSLEPQDDDFVDPLYDKALQFVLEKGQASTSMVQRAFRIGYNRAARIVDMMEREGVVGPMDGAKPRQVIVPHASNED